MLLEFSVKNFLSFKNEITLSLYASAEITEHERYNVFPICGQHLLKTAVIYGANASGKTNLIKAMQFMKNFVVNSFELQSEKEIDIEQFKLNTDTAHSPSEFEVSFLYEDVYYRYGFVIDAKRVHHEWLYYALSEQEIRLFERKFENEADTIVLGEHFSEGAPLVDNQQSKFTRERALFLAVVSQFNGSFSRKVMDWFTNDLKVLFATKTDTFEGGSVKKLGDALYKQEILKFLQAADTAIEDIDLVKVKPQDISGNFPDALKQQIVSKGKMLVTKHSVFNAAGLVTDSVLWSLEDESEGTQKLFALSAPLIETLKKGETLVVDELDSKLHPMIMRFIINLFHSTESNPNHAQLIFATHDTNLLSQRFFRRDQICFTEKDQYGSTDLYSLADYEWDEDERLSENRYKSDYFKGKYGAIPFIGEFKLFFGDSDGER
ncbi:MAG: ATP-binding protein [Candidatus Parabeggiatoa sp. nov. 3]|nr:MAG: ATP-binding protein [Gammaproteobacteria bacterium]RKZ69661.1 MAG: ATP-binding protein [Gammaproteobacteria bacterium]RKZ78536.1 MAG: ATP-binding protein [Gammaproteobacteria bacterium]